MLEPYFKDIMDNLCVKKYKREIVVKNLKVRIGEEEVCKKIRVIVVIHSAVVLLLSL